MKEPYVKGLVSVIIPTYKRTDTLVRAIYSAIYQTYKDIEIFVIDDNEPEDEYSKNVRKLIEKLDFCNLTLVTQKKHVNGSVARNLGIRKAHGEYIAFLDDDDLWLPEKIEKQVNAILSLDSSFGGVSTRKIYLKDGKLTHISERWCVNKHQNFDIISKLLNVSTCTLLLKHVFLDETGYFDESLKRHQEIQLLAFFTEKYKISFLDEVLTIIDFSDVGNRPTAELLQKYKNDYFKAIGPVMLKYNSNKKKLIIAHNMTEVAWVIFRDGNKVIGLKSLFKYFLYPSVVLNFCKRVLKKLKNRNSLNSFDKNKINYINDYLINLNFQNDYINNL